MDYIKLQEKTKTLSKIAIRVGIGFYILLCLALLTLLGIILSSISFPGNLISLATYSVALLALLSYVFREFVEYKARQQINKIEAAESSAKYQAELAELREQAKK